MGCRTGLSSTYQGVEKLSVLVSKYTDEPSCYSPSELRKTLEDFREVLFKHLDDEVCNLILIVMFSSVIGLSVSQVEDLKGDNLRRYFTLGEIDGLM